MTTVLITGCSSGFGLLTTVELARRGDRVFASMRDPSRADALRKALADAGTDASVLPLDVLDDASVDAAVHTVLESAGSIDVVVNNAGIGYVGPLEEIPTEQIEAMFATNIGGMIRVTKAVLPHMRAAGKGHIVNVTSIAAFLSAPFMGGYSATKHAVDALGEALAGEVAPYGIHVTNVAPGAYNTPMVDSVSDFLAAAERSAYKDRFRTFVERHAGMMRAADTPQDVAVAIAEAIHADSPPARVVVPAASEGFVTARGTMPPEQLRAVLRDAYGV
jgi:NAD(P)-dependent dehydrogenase (short-subunit alcohol dehydrogenase family)